MDRNSRQRRAAVSSLPFGFAPQVLPALQVAEWLTGNLDGRRHKGKPDRR